MFEKSAIEKFMVEKSRVEKSRVGKFRVEKSGVEMSFNRQNIQFALYTGSLHSAIFGTQVI